MSFNKNIRILESSLIYLINVFLPSINTTVKIQWLHPPTTSKRCPLKNQMMCPTAILPLHCYPSHSIWCTVDMIYHKSGKAFSYAYFSFPRQIFYLIKVHLAFLFINLSYMSTKVKIGLAVTLIPLLKSLCVRNYCSWSFS